MKKPKHPLAAIRFPKRGQRDLAGAAPVIVEGPHASVERAYLRASIDTAHIPTDAAPEAPLIVPVVFATDTPVRRWDWANDTYFDEVLGMEPAQIDFSRINAGGPVLDSHNTHASVTSQLGVVVAGSARIENGQCVAQLRISSRPGLADFRQDIRDGVVQNISVGYDVLRFVAEVNPRDNSVPVYRATSWQPNEISFVSVPADTASGVRSADEKPAANNLFNISLNMKNYRTQRNAGGAGEGGGGGNTGTGTTTTTTTTGTDSGTGTTTTSTGATGAGTGNTAGTSESGAGVGTDAVAAERQRGVQIRQMVRTMGLGSAVADTLVTEGVSIDVARARAIDMFAGQDPNRARSGAGATTDASANDARAEAYRRDAVAHVLSRSGAGRVLTPEERTGARSFGHMNLMRLAEDCLERAGVPAATLRSMSSRQLANMALGFSSGRGGAQTTSDFPLLLQNAVNRTLVAAYEQAPQTFRQWATSGTLNDFRPTTRVKMSGLVGKFEKIEEGGEYTVASLKETGETIRLAKYGKKVPITWEAIVNDDLSVFNRLPTAIGQKAAQLQSDLVYGLLNSNPTMSDGERLFSAAHKNLAATGDALNILSFDAAMQAFSTQTGEEGDQLNLTPAFLLVGPKMNLAAKQFLTGGYMPVKQSDRNIFADLVQVVVDARITDKSWTLTAAPGVVDTIEYAFLSGEPELFTEDYWDVDTDTYVNKARTVFGTAALDWRGMYRNPGQ